MLYDVRMQEYVDRLQALLEAGDEEGARAAVEAERPKDPARCELGQVILALRQKDAASVLHHAQAAHAAAPHEPLPLHYLLIGNALQGDLEAAARHGREAVRAGGGTPSRLALGSVLTAMGALAEAREIFADVLRSAPAEREAMKGLALCHVQQDNLRGAILEYARIYNLDPSDPGPLARITDLLARMGRLIGPVAAAQLLLEEKPPPEVEVALGLCILRISSALRESLPAQKTEAGLQDAARVLVKSVAGRPRPVRFQAIRALIDAQRATEARALLADLVEEVHGTAERAETLILQGYIAQQEGSPARALAALRTALQMDPSRAEACAVALSLLLDQRPGSSRSESEGSSATAIEGWLGLVSPKAREGDPRLLLQEARYRDRSGQRGEARRLVERAQSLAMAAQDVGLAALCRQLLESL